jgi:hypothetical protein
MKLTLEQATILRVLDETTLCKQAEEFVKAHPAVENSQMAGLLEFSRSWDELVRFVNHQKNNRDWGEPGKSKRAHYKDFYTALDAYLKDLYREVQDQHELVPDGLTKNERRQLTSFYAGLLARDFIQHLVAEMMWQKEVKSQ